MGGETPAREPNSVSPSHSYHKSPPKVYFLNFLSCRQVLHTESRLGTSKSLSIAASVTALNSSVSVIPHEVSLRSSNALDLVASYDLVLDASDNVATRYLLNDACVIKEKPLVSGSALRFEGQLTVYNYKVIHSATFFIGR